MPTEASLHLSSRAHQTHLVCKSQGLPAPPKTGYLKTTVSFMIKVILVKKTISSPSLVMSGDRTFDVL